MVSLLVGADRPESADPLGWPESVAPPSALSRHRSIRSRRQITRWLQARVEVAPSGASAEPYIDGLRALAVLGVITFHAAIAAGFPGTRILGGASPILTTGSWGVELFFVLSGFLLARGWFIAELTGRRPPRAGDFYRRRLWRIVPAYYISIAVALALYLPLGLVSAASVSGRLGLVNIAAHLAFVQHMLPLTSTDFGGVAGVYWTLTIEMTFYAVLPFVVRLFTGRRWILALIGSALITEGWVVLSQHSMGPLVDVMTHSVNASQAQATGVNATPASMRLLLLVQFPAWSLTFACGICLARLVVRRGHGCPDVARPARHLRPGPGVTWWDQPRIGLAALALGLAGLVVIANRVTTELHDVSLPPTWSIYALVPGVSISIALAVFGIVVGPAWLRAPLSTLPMRYLGWVSFGVYLYHLLIIVYLSHFTSLNREPDLRLRFAAILAIALAISIAVATLSWLLIERPLLVRRRGALPASPGPVGSPSPTRRSAQRQTQRARRTRWATIGIGAVAMPLLAAALGWQAQASDARSAALPVPPLGRVEHAMLTPQTSGPATVDSAAATGALFPTEASALRACGATQGVVESLSAPSWGMGGTAFACPTPTAARAAVAAITAAHLATGYYSISSTKPGVGQFGDPITAVPGYPVVEHVVYASGRSVITMAVVARTEHDAAGAVTNLLRACLKRFPSAPPA